ncbi:MAG: DUF1858 domain-containing protein [Candidatus Krumholzibacteriia bacterium]
MSERLDITPEVTVADLLAAWPALEDELIAAAPPFAKLRNPLLRRTIAKVTTLRQAARVGGVALPELIARLRAAAGQPDLAVADDADGAAAARPGWLDTVAVVERYDARADIEAGNHPVGAVLGRVKSLGAGEAYQLVTGFEPTPLIAKARDLGAEAFTAREDGGLFVTTFRLPGE